MDTDGGMALLNAVAKKFPHSKRQRCVQHKMVNVLSYVPKKQLGEVEPELKSIFTSKPAPRLSKSGTKIARSMSRCIQRR